MAAVNECPLLCLDDASLESILSVSNELNYMDLLRITRCCHRLHRLVHQSDCIWQQQYEQQYGAAPRPTDGSYRRLYMDRCISEAKERRMTLKLQRYKLQSDVWTLQRELKQMKQKLDHEQELQQKFSRELRQLQHAQQARLSKQQWHLSSVQLYHNRIVQAAPVTLDAEISNLQQQQRISQLEAKTLQAGIRSRQSKLFARTRQLQALQG